MSKKLNGYARQENDYVVALDNRWTKGSSVRGF